MRKLRCSEVGIAAQECLRHEIMNEITMEMKGKNKIKNKKMTKDF